MREDGLPSIHGSTPLEVRFQLHSEGQRHEVTGTPPAVSGRLPRVTQILALAIHFDEMIKTGEAKDYTDVARLTCLCRERISQIMRLNNLAPDIQVEVLYLPPTPTGKHPISETTLRGIANLLSWTEQRQNWVALNHPARL